jgi:hypothetical protein
MLADEGVRIFSQEDARSMSRSTPHEIYRFCALSRECAASMRRAGSCVDKMQVFEWAVVGNVEKDRLNSLRPWRAKPYLPPPARMLPRARVDSVRGDVLRVFERPDAFSLPGVLVILLIGLLFEASLGVAGQMIVL